MVPKLAVAVLVLLFGLATIDSINYISNVRFETVPVRVLDVSKNKTFDKVQGHYFSYRGVVEVDHERQSVLISKQQYEDFIDPYLKFSVIDVANKSLYPLNDLRHAVQFSVLIAIWLFILGFGTYLLGLYIRTKNENTTT